MSAYIVNAAPMVIQHGTQDLSVPLAARSVEAIPQHLPKFYLYTQKGDELPHLVDAVERVNIFGDKTFDLRSKYANHATVFANAVNAEGNNCIIQRIVPADAGPKANLILWLDVLPATVKIYERNTDGSIKLDAVSGLPVVLKNGENDVTAAGFKVKWVVSSHATKADLLDDFGNLTVKAGDQTDGAVTSQRYPIFELESSGYGDDGNLTGIRLWGLNSRNSVGLPSDLINKERAFPYQLSVIRKPNTDSSPNIVKTIFNDQSIMVVTKPGTIDPNTDKQVYIGDRFLNSYQSLDDVRYAPIYGDIGRFAIYQDNIDTLLGMFHAAETGTAGFINDGWSDFTNVATDSYLFNFVTGMSSYGVPYHTFQILNTTDSVQFSEYTNAMLRGGSDGTMTNALFDNLVGLEFDKYLDPNSELQETATNVESIFYDSGFSLATKKKMGGFIALRKDTAIVVGTHDVNTAIKTAEEEHATAVSLRTYFQMYPESDYFGTPVMRAAIVGRSGLLRNSLFKKHLPLTLEWAIKAARYMGSIDGVWKSVESFSGAPNSVVANMYDINITWVPAGVRNRNWDVGLNWVQAYDRRSFFFPAFKTVYSSSGSNIAEGVLNSFFTMMAICQLNKISHAAWREFSGVDNLSNAQLMERVNTFITNRTAGKFDNRFVIKPDAFVSDSDIINGFSWTLPIKIYADTMKTVMTTYVQAYRKSSLTEA